MALRNESEGPLPARTPDAVFDALLADSARTAERGLAVVRALFCAAVLLRYLTIPTTPGTLLPVLLATGGAIGFSVGVLWRLRARPPSIALLTISVALDVALCLVALSANVLAPTAKYPGLMRMPEVNVIIGMVVAAGLRGHPRLVLLSMALACIGLTGLAFLDIAINPDQAAYGSNGLVMMLLLLCAVGSLAALIARATRRMLRDMGRQTWRGDRAEGSIERLLHEQHDMQAVLSAALIHAQLLSREGESPTLQHLVGDLEVLRASTGAMRTLADAELLALKAPAPVDLAAFLRTTGDRLGHLAPDAAVALDLPEGPAWAVLAGGRLSALRIFANLIKNAAEGDGARGAGRIEVRVRVEGATTRVTVLDDGPGFADAAKVGGTGVGLASVRSLIAASGGDLERRNAASGGAIVTFSLPREPPAG